MVHLLRRSHHFGGRTCLGAGKRRTSQRISFFHGFSTTPVVQLWRCRTCRGAETRRPASTVFRFHSFSTTTFVPLRRRRGCRGFDAQTYISSFEILVLKRKKSRKCHCGFPSNMHKVHNMYNMHSMWRWVGGRLNEVSLYTNHSRTVRKSCTNI